MSVKVDLDQLVDALAEFAFAYLITVSDDHRAHAVAVDPNLHDGVFDVSSVGNSTRGNVTQHPDVTLVWPPREPGGYTLIVDGHGRLGDDGLTVIPHRAVLHRPAPGTPDCLPL